MEIIRAMRKRFRSHQYGDNLLLNLVRFRHLDATDPRDKIYALLGLTQDSETIVHPDYTSSAVECYKRVAISIIRASGSLTIFNLPSTSAACRDPRLPSWAPHWNCELTPDGKASINGVDDFFPLSQDEKWGLHFKASGNSRISCLDMIDSETLGLIGRTTDSVVALETSLRIDSIDTDTDVPDIDDVSLWTWFKLMLTTI